MKKSWPYGATPEKWRETDERRNFAYDRLLGDLHGAKTLHAETGRGYKGEYIRLNRGDPEAKRAAQRRRGPLIAAKWALRAADWAETALVVLLAAWLFFLIGAVLTGTLVVFGYPV